MAPTFDDELSGEIGAEREARHHRAVTVCITCPVHSACNTARRDLGREASGVWAGVSSSGAHLTYTPKETR
jgi:hypothetical protein